MQFEEYLKLLYIFDLSRLSCVKMLLPLLVVLCISIVHSKRFDGYPFQNVSLSFEDRVKVSTVLWFVCSPVSVI